jgi:DNA polymerase III subunit gamma/tau
LSNSLYNKLRPTDFDEVVGQDSTCNLLKASLKNKSVHHSIIIYGPPGTGKTSLARIVASSLTDPEDIIEKDSAVYGKVDDIRSLQSDFIHMPWKGAYKVFIFDEAHRISNLGFDCLLKSIEEPPPHVKFIFVTTCFQQIPITIRSRSLCLRLNYIDTQVIHDYLRQTVTTSKFWSNSTYESFDISDKILLEIASAGKGSIRDTLVILESLLPKLAAGQSDEDILNSLGIIGLTNILGFIQKYLVNDFDALYKVTKECTAQYTDIQLFINDLQQATIDLRLALAFPNKIKDLRTNVENLLEFIENMILKAKDQKGTKTLIGKKLDNIRRLSIELERNSQIAHNKQSLLFGFLVDLATA